MASNTIAISVEASFDDGTVRSATILVDIGGDAGEGRVRHITVSVPGAPAHADVDLVRQAVATGVDEELGHLVPSSDVDGAVVDAIDELLARGIHADEGDDQSPGRRDFYCILGKVNHHLRWDVARRFGIVCAGGGPAYWKPLRHLEPGDRVFAYVGGGGHYVGIGEVTGGIRLFRDVQVDGESLADRPEVPAWQREFARSTDPETAEYAVPVVWDVTVDLDHAIWEKGLFANQQTCRLRDRDTIEFVCRAFGVEP